MLMVAAVVGKLCRQNKLNAGAVPSVFAWTKHSESAVQRRARAEKRNELKNKIPDDVGMECEIETSQPTPVEAEDNVARHVTADKSCQCERPSFCVEKFECDPDAIHFYTGLECFDRFMLVFFALGPSVNYLIYHGGIHVQSISPVNQLFLTLIKLRCNKTNFELSRLFEISETTVENLFITWVNFMYCQLSELPMWPSRDLVSYYMPTDFKRKYRQTRVIFDSTECPIKKPKKPRAQQATFSTYKNRNTIKVLVGSSPGGLVSYISSAYGGSTTDRQIVERSNITSICDPADSIMADKGFNVQDLFQSVGVSVNIPTFFRKRNRMDSKTVLRDRRIASKRVHIERIIGLAKTYKILTQPLPVSYTLLATEITTICFMMCNFRSVIVSTDA